MIPVLPASRFRSGVVLASIAAIAALGAACSQAAADGQTRSEADLKRREPARVRVAPVERREMAKTLSTTTVVESEKEVGVISRASGPVIEVRVEPGDTVEAGAVLAVIDQRESQAILDEVKILHVEAQDGVEKAAIATREAQARVDRTRKEWESATRDYERNEKGNLISEQALDRLRLLRDTALAEHETAKLSVERAGVEEKVAATTLEKAKIAVARQELEHSYSQITAPIAGVVTARNIGVGDIVSPSSQSFTKSAQSFVVTDIENLRAKFHRPQRELAMFQTAMRARGAAPANGGGSAHAAPIEIRGTAEALPGRRLAGEITLVSPAIDAQSGSFEVWVKLRLLPVDADGAAGGPVQRLLPGMLVRLEIVTDRHPAALVVPKRALRREGEANLIFVVRDGKAHRVQVEEGFSEDDSVEVVAVAPATLAPGEPVVVVGNRDLEEGSDVSVEAASAADTKPAEPPADTPAETPATDGK